MVAQSIRHTILERLAGLNEGPLPPEAARFFQNLSFNEQDLARIDELSEKANEGLLTPDEREELSLYVLLNDFLAILHSKARAALRDTRPVT
jgi:uncharacterized protein YnzC (UPF0291/DUF896 family)